jgi:hypothetical protein
VAREHVNFSTKGSTRIVEKEGHSGALATPSTTPSKVVFVLASTQPTTFGFVSLRTTPIFNLVVWRRHRFCLNYHRLDPRHPRLSDSLDFRTSIDKLFHPHRPPSPTSASGIELSSRQPQPREASSACEHFCEPLQYITWLRRTLVQEAPFGV